MDQFFGWLEAIRAAFPSIIWNVYAWLFLAPLLLLSRKLRTWVSATTVAFGTYVGGAVAHWLGKHARHAFAAPVSAYSYAGRALMDNATALLRVPSNKDRALRTDDIFVPLGLEGSGRRILHSEVLTTGNRLRISGDPGSGKSTIMKRLFRDECRKLRTPETIWKAMLPVLIELRHVRVPKTDDAAKLNKELMAYVERALTSVQDYRMDVCLEAYIGKRGLLLLLDGADEIQSSDYPRIERAIIALSEKLARDSPQSKIVLTMRSQFETRLGRDLRETFPVTFLVQRFTPSDVFQFLRNWPFGDDRDARVSRIYNDLVDRPNLREMCTNPLVLSMYVAEDEARNPADLQSSPAAAETRAEFYRDVVEELLFRRRESQTGRKEAPHLFRELAIHDKQVWLVRAAG
jgi:NACHT domain